LELLHAAERLGIHRFRANLIIATVQHEHRGEARSIPLNLKVANEPKKGSSPICENRTDANLENRTDAGGSAPRTPRSLAHWQSPAEMRFEARLARRPMSPRAAAPAPAHAPAVSPKSRWFACAIPAGDCQCAKLRGVRGAEPPASVFLSLVQFVGSRNLNSNPGKGGSFLLPATVAVAVEIVLLASAWVWISG
jgi:hypothetical protein